MIGGALLRDDRIISADKEFKQLMKNISILDLIVAIDKAEGSEGYIKIKNVTLKYFKTGNETIVMLHKLDERSQNLIELGAISATISHDFNNVINVGIVAMIMIRSLLEKLKGKKV